MKNKLVLIDGYSVAFRAFYGAPLLNNGKGLHTGAVFGFAMMLNKIIDTEKPTHLLVAFDAGKKTFRHEFFPEYKAGRSATPQELLEQFPLVKELLDVRGIVRYEKTDYEADDIIGTLATLAEACDFEVCIISGDRDLTQLASNKTTVRITKKGLTQTEDYTPDYVLEKLGITSKQIVDLKGLMGDSSDNIPGVPGVGEKTALKLLHAHGSIENLYNSLDQVAGKKLLENLINNKDKAFLSKKLAQIKLDVPLDLEISDLEYRKDRTSKSELISFYRRLGMKVLAENVASENNEGDAEELDETKEFSYEIVSEITEKIFTAELVHFYVEILDDATLFGDILGFGLATPTQAYFLPTELVASSKVFKEWAEDEGKQKMVFDAKKCVIACKRLGITLKGISFDALLAGYLLNPSEKHEDLSSISKDYKSTFLPSDEAIYGKGKKRIIPEKLRLSEFIAKKGLVLQEIYPLLKENLVYSKLMDLLINLEIPVSLVLSDMEWTGITVNKDILENMSGSLKARLLEIEQTIYQLAGEKFNIMSPKQMGVVLFERLGLPTAKKTKTGYSTSAEVLTELAGKHPVIEEILLYRQLSKLYSTYVEGMQKSVSFDGKVHTRFNQVLTQTGRLSSLEPNLQNIPIRLKEGKEIRKAFVASKPDWGLFGADYSQIELRVLAHMSGDLGLTEAFLSGLDIHTKTAMDVFGISEKEVTSVMRRQAKAVNFGIVYGMSDFGLAQNLGISRWQAKSFIEKYFAKFSGVETYMKEVVESARQNGYVTTLLDRRRYIPEINSPNFNVRSFAERTAMNTPIQGSGADIIKLAMVNVARRLQKEKLQARLLLQVHDELIIEAPRLEMPLLEKIVPYEMENVVKLSVPLKVDYAYGLSWYDV